ncbi:MAG: hypothetical protein AB8G77_20475 [Rhodothermales bacterium]
MKKLLLALLFFMPAPTFAQQALKIDPLTLVAVREARSIEASLDLFPGWDFSTAPVLLYRPGVQDVLLNTTDPPDGFTLYDGHSPLENEPIWIRNDSTHFDLDGQNTATQIDGQRVLVVADPASQMRNDIRAFAGMASDQQERWLENWSFLGSPYDLITIMLHEGFHVHQYAKGEKFADESLIASYPLYDATNNAMQALEGLILLDAARGAIDPAMALRLFAAVRSTRHARLGAELTGYELANEYVEGLAKYVEYRFYMTGASLVPHPETYLMAGFDGYDRLAERFDDQLEFAELVIRGEIAVNNDRFGAGNLRFRLYPMGALQGLLLDQVFPDWTGRIFDPGVFPSTMLVEAAGLSASEADAALDEAKAQYGYDSLFQKKEVYEQEGLAAAQNKATSLVETGQTLVRIQYGALSDESPDLGFTPFGVTPLGNGQAIYELVPINADFGEASSLSVKIVTPVLVDTVKREILFSVDMPAHEIIAAEGEIKTDAFDLIGGIKKVSTAGNEVSIEL